MSKSTSTSMTKGAASKSSRRTKTIGDKKSASRDRFTKRTVSAGCLVSSSGRPERKAAAAEPAVTRTAVSSIPAPSAGNFRGVTQEHLDSAIARIRRMTKAERIQSLINCGILTPAGKLAGHYCG